MAKPKDERVAFSGDVVYYEKLIALAIQSRGPFTFDPADFHMVEGMTVVVMPHETDPNLMVAVTASHADAAKVNGRPGKGRMH
jgi:hypothetical protein